jgi:hypothetical protein
MDVATRPAFRRKKREQVMTQSIDPFRRHTPYDDPAPGTPGTGQDTCPQCEGTGKQADKSGEPTDQPCERCEGTGKVIQGIG